jgi:Chemoreceptor zinc-binding domain
LAAHAEWKARVGEAVARGTSEFTVAGIARDDLCVFGRWLYGDGLSPAEKASFGYAEVCRLHARFHSEAARVLELALSGNRWEAAAAMGDGRPYARASADLINALTAWHEQAAA